MLSPRKRVSKSAASGAPSNSSSSSSSSSSSADHNKRKLDEFDPDNDQEVNVAVTESIVKRHYFGPIFVKSCYLCQYHLPDSTPKQQKKKKKKLDSKESTSVIKAVWHPCKKVASIALCHTCAGSAKSVETALLLATFQLCDGLRVRTSWDHHKLMIARKSVAQVVVGKLATEDAARETTRLMTVDSGRDELLLQVQYSDEKKGKVGRLVSLSDLRKANPDLPPFRFRFLDGIYFEEFMSRLPSNFALVGLRMAPYYERYLVFSVLPSSKQEEDDEIMSSLTQRTPSSSQHTDLYNTAEEE